MCVDAFQSCGGADVHDDKKKEKGNCQQQQSTFSSSLSVFCHDQGCGVAVGGNGMVCVITTRCGVGGGGDVNRVTGESRKLTNGKDTNKKMERWEKNWGKTLPRKVSMKG